MNHAYKELVRLVQSLEARTSVRKDFDELTTLEMVNMLLGRLRQRGRQRAVHGFSRVRIIGGRLKRQLHMSKK